jgi:hypothetical protein
MITKGHPEECVMETKKLIDAQSSSRYPPKKRWAQPSSNVQANPEECFVVRRAEVQSAITRS